MRARTVIEQAVQLRTRIDCRHEVFLVRASSFGLPFHRKPIVRMRAECEDVSGFLDRWKSIATEDFNRNATGKIREIELHRLREAGKIYDDKHGFVFVTAEKGKNSGIVGKKKLERAARERLEIFPHRDDATHPPNQRGHILLLIFDADRFVMII